MKIGHLKINHLENPLGFDLAYPTLSYVVTEARGTKQVSAHIVLAEDAAFQKVVFDSGERADIVSTGFPLPVALSPMTRYYWKVSVTDDTGDRGESAAAWFETAKDVCRDVCGNAGGSGAEPLWQAKWISPELPKEVQAVLWKEISIEKPVAAARAYMTGLGVYEVWLNGEKQGDECLLPGFHAYDSWLQYQTFALSLREGSNRLEILLGDGWYKGNYGLIRRYENYGDALAAIAELHIRYADGTEEVIGTDRSWNARKSRIVKSGIYCGEVYDATLPVEEAFAVKETDLGYGRLCPRLSPPITIHERLRPVAVLHSPRGETILDMGQNMTGWISFHCTAPAGAMFYLQTGEILQDECFYNENLRTAKSEFTYISDGQERWVREHFTFHGFRYVRLTEWPQEVRAEDFEGLVIHSDMEELSDLQTSDPLVNQLVHNAKWGMKGNFLDVPTDCPQRDERYGWTGDAQIFSGTACYFMDTAAFYAKYGRDLYVEQKKLGGSVPDVVPVCNYPGDASTAWADAATVIPWNVWLHTGDKGILLRQYDSMKAWVDYMKRQDDADGGTRLWRTGTHYGDWLALDGKVPGGVYGATEANYIASAYYCYSAGIVAKAAAVLGKAEDAASYGKLAEEVREAFRREYFTPGGRLAMDTMTGYVVALYMGLVPEDAVERCRWGLMDRLRKNRNHLETGFVGTPYLCRVLSENGMNDLAYHLLMEQGYPGWLYEVRMGATTIWERWNSVGPDGKLSGTEMNSLNHYSYGSIVEWMFRDMLGIQPSEDGAGFKRFRLAPLPNYRISRAAARFRTASGEIRSAWEIDGGALSFTFRVPFDTEAEVVLPDARMEDIAAALEQSGQRVHSLRQAGKDVVFTCGAGDYRFHYQPTAPCRKVYCLNSPWEELKENPKTMAILKKAFQTKEDHIPFDKELYTLEEMTWGPFTAIPQAQRETLDRLLREVE